MRNRGIEREHGELREQREVIDEHRGAIAVRGERLGQAVFAVGAAFGAPRLPGGMRIRVQEALVGALEPGLERPRARGVRGQSIGAERIVVQREERRDDARPAVAVEDEKGVLGSGDAVLPGHGDQRLAFRFAAEAIAVADGPQLVVARHPDEPAEARAQRGENEAQVVERLPHVAGEREPVLRVRRDALDRLPVLGVPHVQVAERPELHGAMASKGTTPAMKCRPRMSSCYLHDD